MGQNPKSWRKKAGGLFFLKIYKKDKWKPCDYSGHNHRAGYIGQKPKSDKKVWESYDWKYKV